MANIFSITGNLVDVHQEKIYAATITVEGERIKTIQRVSHSAGQPLPYILPGFTDAHVHIESSMLVPSEFARLAVVHGTVATVSDPHEIANVCGMKGVEYMIGNGAEVPFKSNFGAPSCVPATAFETAGAAINAAGIEALMRRDEVLYLAEMMNFPGVLNKDAEVMKKIAAAKKAGKPVDGHAPGLRGEAAKQYIDAGISTDHECFTAEEALEKLAQGMKILIREGSAAKNFEALIGLLHDYPDQMMFCSDDKHPDSLVEGHIDQLCRRAVAHGIDLFKVLKAACVNPVKHYSLKVGLLRVADFADFIVIRDLEDMEVLQTYINGQLVADKGRPLIEWKAPSSINHFACSKKEAKDFEVRSRGEEEIAVMEALDGQLITNRLLYKPKTQDGKIIADTEQDILKIAVINRYKEAAVAIAFVRNFGLKRGAIALSVAHDSHNIIAVGVDDGSMAEAVNLIIGHKGGISCIGAENLVLPLPVAGLMSADDGYEVATAYAAMDAAAKAAGSALSAPFMTLSFMALLVIPHLKLSDKGLFDGDNFQLVGS